MREKVPPKCTKKKKKKRKNLVYFFFYATLYRGIAWVTISGQYLYTVHIFCVRFRHAIYNIYFCTFFFLFSSKLPFTSSLANVRRGKSARSKTFCLFNRNINIKKKKTRLRFFKKKTLEKNRLKKCFHCW